MYFIIEHQTRPDGVINVSETSRQSFAAALSLYHERYSKMVMNEQFVSVSIMLVDADLNMIQHDTIETLYKPAEEES